MPPVGAYEMAKWRLPALVACALEAVAGCELCRIDPAAQRCVKTKAPTLFLINVRPAQLEWPGS